MLNITFVIVLLADIALAADSRTLGSIIASRQVTAQSLRQGTKRLSARQNAPSLAPTLALSPYTQCPDLFRPYRQISQEIEFYATEGTGRQNQIDCYYGNFQGPGSARCIYSGNDGELLRRETTSSLVKCPLYVDKGPPEGELCYLECPRRMNGYYLAAGNVKNLLDGQIASISCQYSTEAFDLDTTIRTCEYNAEDGALLSEDPTNFGCQAAIDKGKNCAVRSRPLNDDEYFPIKRSLQR